MIQTGFERIGSTSMSPIRLVNPLRLGMLPDELDVGWVWPLPPSPSSRQTDHPLLGVVAKDVTRQAPGAPGRRPASVPP